MSKNLLQTKDKKNAGARTNLARRRPNDMSHIQRVPVARKLGLIRRLLFVAVATVALVVPATHGQINGPLAPASVDVKSIEFDVVSIKPDKSGSGNVRVMNKPDGYSGTNVTLKMVLEMAYGIKEDLISGEPSWADSASFDIEAKIAEADVAELKKLDKDQRELARKHMLQAFLADRFQLKTHIDVKQLPVYELLIAKGGPKITPAKPGDAYANGVKGPDGVAHAGMMMIGNEGTSMQLTGQGIPLTSLVAMLSRQLHRTVLDKTGLAGNYDIKLKWTPEDTSASAGSGVTDSQTDAGPSIFSALQEQLGLRLQSTKGPVDTLIIDHAEKPSEN